MEEGDVTCPKPKQVLPNTTTENTAEVVPNAFVKRLFNYTENTAEVVPNAFVNIYSTTRSSGFSIAISCLFPQPAQHRKGIKYTTN